MEAFISYFIKVNVVISILYFVYWLLLREEKFFQLNRAFLLSALVISLILPLIPATVSQDINKWQHHVTAMNPFANNYGTEQASSVMGLSAFEFI